MSSEAAAASPLREDLPPSPPPAEDATPDDAHPPPLPSGRESLSGGDDRAPRVETAAADEERRPAVEETARSSPVKEPAVDEADAPLVPPEALEAAAADRPGFSSGPSSPKAGDVDGRYSSPIAKMAVKRAPAKAPPLSSDRPSKPPRPRRPSERAMPHPVAVRASRETMVDAVTTGPHLNRLHWTTGEEYAVFRARNRVSPSYQGPIYVAEDLHVTCRGCGGLVDPIRRVPVGRLFFHPGCVQCYLCDRHDIAEPYTEVDNHAVCSYCTGKGFSSCVRREEATSRDIVLGAIRGNVLDVFKRDEARRQDARFTVNRPTVPGAVAPSLSLGMVHNPRNTSSRTFNLLHRQQYYTQNDGNILARRPPEGMTAGGPGSASRRSSRANPLELPRLQ